MVKSKESAKRYEDMVRKASTIEFKKLWFKNYRAVGGRKTFKELTGKNYPRGK